MAAAFKSTATHTWSSDVGDTSVFEAAAVQVILSCDSMTALGFPVVPVHPPRLPTTHCTLRALTRGVDQRAAMPWALTVHSLLQFFVFHTTAEAQELAEGVHAGLISRGLTKPLHNCFAVWQAVADAQDLLHLLITVHNDDIRAAVITDIVTSFRSVGCV